MHGFEKLVVLKRILPQHAESEDFIRMFLAEARLAGTLHHPNIAQVYDIGEDAGAHFFTMEYVQGQDLRKIVRAARRAQRPIPLEHILHIVMGVAAGLHHAHTQVGLDGQPLGIVHRDVSPSNVLVTYEGSVKIVDFGIAKAATAQVATIAGTLKGKIPYMSPEQCRGEIVDCRSDIFSIGTLLWELTTGKRLFSGENEFAILNRVAKGDVPLPSSVRPEYPPELEAIVMRALQSDPEQRYSQAIDLQIDLEDFAREARLPVSSARMAKFMAELFEEEIEAEHRDLTNPAVASASLLESAPGDFTPAELGRTNSTTGPSDDPSGAEPGTDVLLGRVGGRRRVGPWVAAITGFVATLGVIGGFTLGRQDDVAEPEPEVRSIEAAVVPSEDEDAAQPDSEPASPGTQNEAQDAAGDVDVVILPEPQPDASKEQRSDAGEDDEEEDAAEESEDNRASSDRSRRRRRSSHRRSRRSSSKKKAKSSASNEEKKWDSKSMLPPGL